MYAERWKRILISFRITQVICAVIVLALIGNMINTRSSATEGTVNYCLFPPAFALAVNVFAFPGIWWPKLYIHSAILFIFELLVTLSTFAAAVALPAKLHARDCGNRQYTSTNEITDGFTDQVQACREAQASTAFLWFLWAAFLATTVMTGMTMTEDLKSEFGRGRRAGVSEKGPLGGPHYPAQPAVYGGPVPQQYPHQAGEGGTAREGSV